MCRSIWAKFDTASMSIGFAGLLILLVTQCLQMTKVVTLEIWQLNVLHSLVFALSLVLCYLELSSLYNVTLLLTSSSLLLISCGKWCRPTSRLTIVDLLSIAAVGCLSVSSLSNSLVVEEEKITHYLLNSLIVVGTLYCCIKEVKAKKPTHKFPKKSLDSVCSITLAILKLPQAATAAILGFLLALSRVFNACREEQLNCTPSHFLTPLYSLTSDEAPAKNIRFFFLCIPCLIVAYKLPLKILRSRGNLNGLSPLVLVSNYVMPTSAVLLLLHWAVTSSSSVPERQTWLLVLFARVIYAVTALVAIACFLFPLTIHFSTQRKVKKQQELQDVTVPSLYKLMRERFKPANDDEYSLPLVYGLGSALSSNYVIFVSAMTFLLMMLAGDGMSLSVFIMFLSLLLSLDLYKSWRLTSKSVH